MVNIVYSLFINTTPPKKPIITTKNPILTIIFFLEIFKTKNKNSRTDIANISKPKKDEKVFLKTKSNFCKSVENTTTTSTILILRYKLSD